MRSQVLFNPGGTIDYICKHFTSSVPNALDMPLGFVQNSKNSDDGFNKVGKWDAFISVLFQNRGDLPVEEWIP